MTEHEGDSWAPRGLAVPQRKPAPRPDKPRCALCFSLSQQADRPVCPGLAAQGLSEETRAPLDLFFKKGRSRRPASCPGGRPKEFLRKPLSKTPKPYKSSSSALHQPPPPPRPRLAAFHPVSPLQATRPGPPMRPC